MSIKNDLLKLLLNLLMDYGNINVVVMILIVIVVMENVFVVANKKLIKKYEFIFKIYFIIFNYKINGYF